MRLLPLTLLSALVSECQGLSFGKPTMGSYLGNDFLTVPVINPSFVRTSNVVAWFNETLTTDLRALPSPGPGYSSPTTREDVPFESRVAFELEKLVDVANEDTVPVLYLTLSGEQHVPSPVAQSLQKCFKSEDSADGDSTPCGYVRRTARSASCSPSLRIFNQIHIAMLDYSEVIGDCSIEDIQDDVGYLAETLVIEDVETARKEEWLDEPEPEEDFEILTPHLLEAINEDREKEAAKRQEANEGKAELRGTWGTTTPNDELGVQWHEKTFGSIDMAGPESINGDIMDYEPLVAIITNAVYFDHPDLSANMWINRLELLGTADADDDGNGYIDDVHGWTAGVGKYRAPSPDAFSPPPGTSEWDDWMSAVGTRNAGQVAAVTDNRKGIASVAQNHAKLAICSYTTTAVSVHAQIAECVDWSLSVGARVIFHTHYKIANFPVAPDAATRAAYNAALAKDVLVVMTPGSDNQEIGNGQRYTYPSCYNWPNMISIAGSTRHRRKLSTSNYGSACVTAAGPAEYITTTAHGTGYPFRETYVRGNDPVYGAAYVAGGAALMLRMNPFLNVYDMKRLLRRSVKEDAIEFDQLADPITFWGGAVNLKHVQYILNGGGFEEFSPDTGSQTGKYANIRRTLPPSSSTEYSWEVSMNSNYLRPGQPPSGTFVVMDVDEKYQVREKITAEFGYDSNGKWYFKTDYEEECRVRANATTGGDFIH